MAKKTRTPEEQKRIEERIAFVQANPQLSKAEARKRFYVQTRAKELEAQGKPVNRQALRQKFEMGQVTRGGFYTESDIAASQARIRSSANPMPRNNDTGRSNVTPGYTPGVQGGVKVPGQRTGRETGPGTGSFVTGKPKTTNKSAVKQDNSLLARGLRKVGFKTEGLIDMGFSKQDILNRARNPKQLINTYDALMKQGNKRELFGVSSSDIPVFREVQRGVQKKFLYDLGSAESYAASSINRAINRSKPVQKFFGEKPNLREAGKMETALNAIDVAFAVAPVSSAKVVGKVTSKIPGVKTGGRLLKPIAKKGASKVAPVLAGMGMSDLAPKVAKFAEEGAQTAATTAAKGKAAKSATKGTKGAKSTTVAVPEVNAEVAPAAKAGSKTKTTRTTKAKPASKTTAPSPQTRAQNAVDANKAARNASTGRATEAPTGKAATKPTLPPEPPKQPAPKLSNKAKKPRTGEPAPAPSPQTRASNAVDANKAARNTGTGRANEAPAAPAPQTRKENPMIGPDLGPEPEVPSQDWWSDRGGRLNTDLRGTGGTVASQESAAAAQPTRKTGRRKKVELPENLQGKSVALGSEERKAAEETADALLGKKPKKSTSTAKTKTQVENQAAKPARQKRLPKAKNTGGGRGKATSLDEITFSNPDKFDAALSDPRFQKMWDDATPAQQEAFRQRNKAVREASNSRSREKGAAELRRLSQSNPSPTPRGEAPSAPAPTQSSRMDTGARGTGRANYQSAEIDDMSVGGYEVNERAPLPAPEKKAGKTKKAVPAKKTAPAKKAAPAKREPKAAPEVVTDTLDSRAVQKEINAVESEISRIEDREKTLREGRGRGLSEADINKLDELRIKHRKLTDSLAQFNVKIQKETDKAARIGGTRD